MISMSQTASQFMELHVPPDEIVKYIQDLMTLPHRQIAASTAAKLANQQWGEDAPLLIADEHVVFDIPALLDATLDLSPAAGQA
jgi:hypothetical protein